MLLRIGAYIAVFVSLFLVGEIAVQLVGNYRRRFIAQTEERVESLYMNVKPERFWIMTLIATIVGALLMGLVSDFSLVLILVGGVAGFLSPRLYLNFMAQRRQRAFDKQLLEAIPMVAGAMKTGMSLMQAMEYVTREMGPPIRQEFAHALQENQVGKPIIQALRDMKSRIRSEDLNVTVDAISIAQETGGVLSDLLLKLADAIRSRNRVKGKINTLSAQGRLQGIIMIFLPWIMAAVVFMLDPNMMRPMFTTTIGQLTLVIIGVFEFVGWLVIRRLVAIDV